MDFFCATKMAPGVSEGIMSAENESGSIISGFQQKRTLKLLKIVFLAIL